MAMFENISVFFKRFMQNDKKELVADTTASQSKDAAKERLHVVLMQDRANVSADFLELMKEEILDVIKKYIVIDEDKLDVRLMNQENEDGSIGAPLLHANIPILNIRNDVKGEYLNEEETSHSEPHEEKTTETSSDSERTQIIQVVKDITDVPSNTSTENENKENINNENTIKFELPANESEKEVNQHESESMSNPQESDENKPNIDNIQMSSNDFDDEDDDDVTFDDLLKAAEEEEKQKKKQSSKTNSKAKKTKSKPKTTSQKKRTSKAKKED